MSINNIDNIYSYRENETKIINDNFFVHTDWDKDVFLEIKRNIISHLRIEQENKCCYCKYELGYDIKQVDIEHIIAKSRNERFTFNLSNLALSCPGCNTKKSTQKVLTADNDEQRVHYPNTGTSFKIIHAHFDNYFEHIKIINNQLYAAVSKKGSETITICGLYRFDEIEKKIFTNKIRIKINKFETIIKKGRTISKELSNSLKNMIR